MLIRRIMYVPGFWLISLLFHRYNLLVWLIELVSKLHSISSCFPVLDIHPFILHSFTRYLQRVYSPCSESVMCEFRTKEHDDEDRSKCISQVTSGCKCEPPDSLVPVKTTLHKIPRCILALGSHISTLGSLDMSLSKALTAAEWEVWIEEGRESYTQDFEF